MFSYGVVGKDGKTEVKNRRQFSLLLCKGSEVVLYRHSAVVVIMKSLLREMFADLDLNRPDFADLQRILILMSLKKNAS